ncbi:DUF4920 domain-containing protein [Glaciecola sp. SC05]|uniref:DUF4920 domain-containing protein n=1 Tax=Glaciecola sp. SC05 TaxID=1987355 RepID=UPI003529998A
MKSIVLILLITSFASLSYAKTLRLSEPVASDATSETFGLVFDTSLPNIALSQLDSSPSKHLEQMFTLEAPIAKVCQKKGCFFIIQSENRVFRVSFRDYGFFIPTDSSGKNIVLNGELVQKELTPEQASHFQADLQVDTDSIRAGLVYEIVADSIRIPSA